MNVYTKMLISIVFLYVINVKSKNKVIEILKWFLSYFREQNGYRYGMISIVCICESALFIYFLFTVADIAAFILVFVTYFGSILCLSYVLYKVVRLRGKTILLYRQASNILVYIVCLFVLNVALSRYLQVKEYNYIVEPLGYSIIFFIIVLLIRYLIYIVINEAKYLKDYKSENKMSNISNIVFFIICLLGYLLIYILLYISNGFVLGKYLLYLPLVFIIYNVAIQYFRQFYVWKDKVDITFLNLSYEDILRSNIYINEKEVKDLDDFRVFKIELKEFFPVNSKCKKIQLLNHKYMEGPLFDHEGKTYFYICIRKKLKRYNTTLILNLHYQVEGKKRVARVSIVMDFININNEIICKEHIVEKFHRMYKPVFQNEIKVKNTADFHYGKLFERSYIYNFDMNHENETNKLLKSNEIRDIRRFVLHDDKYGKGKTTLDVLYSSNLGFIPIVVSPWEENYDEDILYLIFDKVMKAADNNLYMPNKNVFIFYIASIIAFTTLLNDIIKFLYLALNEWKSLIFGLIEQFGPLKILFEIIQLFPKDAIIGILSLFISIILSLKYMPTIIIHTKNSTRVHQKFYLDAINKQLLSKKIMLIIEDVDRLEEKSVRNVFRLISSINHMNTFKNAIIGIITFNTKEEVISNLDNDLASLKNKTIRGNIFMEYSSIDSMIAYLRQYLYALSLAYKTCIQEEDDLDKLLNLIPWSDVNFRDIYTIITNINSVNPNGKSLYFIVEVSIKEYLEMM